jgi:protein-S-isoprenylcysteine O-methyltransferase Ste14
MQRIAFFVYGLTSYLLFFGCFLYSIGFVGNLVVPKAIDTVAAGASGAFTLRGLLVNLGLLSIFAVQHSVMARPAFKRWWTRIVPQPIERSTYVLFSTLALVLLIWVWQPMTGVVWSIGSETARTAVTGIYFFGWGLLLYATLLIDHFDLFGLRQVTMNLRGTRKDKSLFVTPALYKVVRHPIYVAWITIFWAVPTMTVGHLVFSVMCTTYILVAIQLEERDLIDEFGDTYRAYRERTPMLVPRPRRSAPGAVAPSGV